MTHTLYSLGETRTVLLGDFNVKSFNYAVDVGVRKFIDLFVQFDFMNESNPYTCVSPITQTAISCLDHTWDNLKTRRRSFLLRPNLSDHYDNCLVLNKKIAIIPVKLKFRKFSA